MGEQCGTLTGFTKSAYRHSGGGARVAHAGHTSLCPRLQMFQAFGLQMFQAFGLQMFQAFGLFLETKRFPEMGDAPPPKTHIHERETGSA